MNDCEKIHPLIPFYAEKSLSPARRDLVEAHLKICPEAQQDLESVQVLFEAMAGMPEPDAPLDLHRKIMDYVIEEKKPVPVPVKKPEPIPGKKPEPVYVSPKKPFQFFPYWALATSGLAALLMLALNPGLWESARVSSPRVVAEENVSSSQTQAESQTDKTQTYLAMNKPARFEKVRGMAQAPPRPARVMAMRARKKSARHRIENTEVLAYAKKEPAEKAPEETVLAMNRFKAADESSLPEPPPQENAGGSKDLAAAAPVPMAAPPMAAESKAESPSSLQAPQLYLPTNTVPEHAETASLGQPMTTAALPASGKKLKSATRSFANVQMQSSTTAASGMTVTEGTLADTSKEVPPPPESGYSEEMGPAITSSSGLTMAAANIAPSSKEIKTGPVSIYSGDNGLSTVEQVGLITDSKTLQETWKFLRPEEPAPKLDFDNQAIVFLQAGEEPTGGYSVNMTSLDQGEDQWVVHWKVEGPADDSTVSETVTRPWTLQVIPKPDKPVEFQKEKP